MRKIEMDAWGRREHFAIFNGMDYPHFSMCANVDVTGFYPAVKERRESLTVAIVFVLAKAANAIPEFRYRIRAGEVIEHEVVHPSTTILATEELFSFCTMEYADDFRQFATQAAERIAFVQANPTLNDGPGQDDLLFMTAIPWVSFTSFMHPIHMQPVDSVPRFAWGKFFKEGETLKMPLSVQVHHALMDGLHVGRFYADVQDSFWRPEALLG